ncbi:MAG: hypothetical protein IPH34_09145 [Chitinophagaceae bacterium]|nr:hypothetical protein [Chitinophagaceae bacterium]
MEQSFFDCKTIFLISPEPWDYISVSKHHYAIALAKKGNTVCFINPPVKRIAESIVIEEVVGVKDLFVVSYKPFATGLRFLPRYFMNLIERKFLKKIEKRINLNFDVILNFENSRFYDFHFVSPEVLKIYFQVDQNQDFHPEIAARTADIVFAINDEILGIVKPFNENSFKISHSFQGNLSEQAQQILEGKYIYTKAADRLQVMYVGNHEDYGKIFAETLNNLEQLNCPEKMKARITFALDCTYPRQLDKIDELIRKTISKKTIEIIFCKLRYEKKRK